MEMRKRGAALTRKATRVASQSCASNMADKSSQGDSKPEAQFARRIDPAKDELTKEQMQFIRQVEMAQWKKNTSRLRGRNLATGLAIGAVVLGIYGYTFYSVSQEKIMDEVDEEAKARASKTGV